MLTASCHALDKAAGQEHVPGFSLIHVWAQRCTGKLFDLPSWLLVGSGQSIDVRFESFCCVVSLCGPGDHGVGKRTRRKRTCKEQARLNRQNMWREKDSRPADTRRRTWTARSDRASRWTRAWKSAWRAFTGVCAALYGSLGMSGDVSGVRPVRSGCGCPGRSSDLS